MGHINSRAATVHLEFFVSGVNNYDMYFLTHRHTVVRVYKDTPEYYYVRHPQMLRFDPHDERLTSVMRLDKRTGYIIPDHGISTNQCVCRWQTLEYLPPVPSKS